MTACIVGIQVLPEEARDQKKLKKLVFLMEIKAYIT